MRAQTANRDAPSAADDADRRGPPAPASPASGPPAPASGPPVGAPDDRPPAAPPDLFVAPTARLLPAGAVYARAGVDTGGGIAIGARVGLGDVAEFGLATTDLIRHTTDGGEPNHVQPYVLAAFKMGVREHLIFPHQPALAIEFRKSFEHEIAGRATRVAALQLTATKHLGSRVAVHAGAVVWDASVRRDDGTEFALHERPIRRQLRGYGGVEVAAAPRAQIGVDLYWVPQFDLTDARDDVVLAPSLAWGVRYRATRAVQFESGVRLPDVRDVNLLEAQIFGRVAIATDRARAWLARRR
ncbi:MAG: hypothetical protein D6689_02780 [Deltaproteobacteria bacterium]|nr:MAG: hypothetical protein D6689_02780 [Deltaproteobacteria bacterium]